MFRLCAHEEKTIPNRYDIVIARFEDSIDFTKLSLYFKIYLRNVSVFKVVNLKSNIGF